MQHAMFYPQACARKHDDVRPVVLHFMKFTFNFKWNSVVDLTI